MYILHCLGPAAYNLKHKSSLDPEDEFFLVLIKLRLNKEDQELGFFFGLSLPAVGRIFHTWIAFLFFHLKEVNLWLSREQIQETMPDDFKRKFPTTRVIIDGTEFPIEAPSNVKDQRVTWSSYKNKNTVKILVGISPRGMITFVSDAYGGSCSDRQLVQASDLLQKDGMFSEGDSIMSDRGFNVQDLFCLRGVHLNLPSFLRNTNQLPSEVVIKDRRIASKRVHVERVIGLAKRFKILSHPLHKYYLSIAGRIIFVCFALTNFKPAIVSRL